MPTAKPDSADVVTRYLLDERTCRIMAIIAADKELQKTRYDAQQSALSLASAEAEKNYHRLNELRERCVSIAVYEQGHRILDGQVRALEKIQDEQRGKASMGAVYLVAIGTGIGWLIAIAGLVHSFIR